MRGVVLEVKVAEILINAQSAAVRQDRQQIEFAGEIEVRQQAVARLQVFQPGKRREIAGLAVGGEFEGVRRLVAEHDHILKPVVVHVAHQAAAIGHAGFGGQEFAERLEPSVLIAQDAKALFAFHHKEAVASVVVAIQHRHRPVII